MARRSAPCTQADITRFIKGALAAGIELERIVIKLTRNDVTLLLRDPDRALNEPNEWDDLLPVEQRTGKRRRGGE